MKKLIHVGNTGEGHLSLRFDGYAPKTDVGFKTFDKGMISLLGDEETEEVHEIEVLFLEDEGRVEVLMQVAKLYELDLTPLFSTYAGPLAA